MVKTVENHLFMYCLGKFILWYHFRCQVYKMLPTNMRPHLVIPYSFSAQTSTSATLAQLLILFPFTDMRT